MFNIKFFILFISLCLLVAGCGGGGIFDAFQPRPAALQDFSGRDFRFSWLPDGNPIQANLGKMGIRFGAFDGNQNGTFTIEELDGGSATGNASFAGTTLTFNVTSVNGDIPVTNGYAVTVTVEADVSDGRIRLTNNTTNAEVTSDK